MKTKTQAKPSDAAKRKYLDGVSAVRGFRFGLHEIHAESDWEFTQKYEEWMRFIYVNDRFLDRRAKELVLTGVLCALRAPTQHIQAHMSKAVEAGSTSEEIIEVVELAGHWGGSVVTADGLAAWRLQFAPHLPGIFDPVSTKKRSRRSA